MSPRRKTVQVEVENEYAKSAVYKVREAVEAALGGDLHVHLVREPRLDPARMTTAMTGRPRFRPLRWSDLDAKVKREIENFVPYIGTEDFVKYGDTILMTCPKSEWEAEQQRKARVAIDAYGSKAASSQFAKETGLPIDTEWEDVSNKFKAPS